MTAERSWHVEGDLLDMCNCELLCPCHVSFRQKSTYDICEGLWVANVEKGAWNQLSLDGLKAMVIFHCPQPVMYEGDWTAVLYVDERASQEQEAALTEIFSGQAGGPWARMVPFFKDGKFQAIKRAAIDFTKEGRTFRVSTSTASNGAANLEIQAIRGVNSDDEVKITNLRNVIHGEEHILARSDHRVDDEGLRWDYAGKNGLYSRFSWSGP